MNWENMLQNLGIFTLLIAGMAWVSRELFKGMMSRDIEKFKSDLEKEAIKFRIRYERLHDERVGVIKEVYKKIVQAHESLRSLINPWQGAGEPTEDEKSDKASKCNMELITYYQENRIFFEEQLAEEIDSLLTELREAWSKFQLSRASKEDSDHKEARQEWSKAWTQIDEQVPIVKKKLESSFRANLGIENQ